MQTRNHQKNWILQIIIIRAPHHKTKRKKYIPTYSRFVAGDVVLRLKKLSSSTSLFRHVFEIIRHSECHMLENFVLREKFLFFRPSFAKTSFLVLGKSVLLENSTTYPKKPVTIFNTFLSQSHVTIVCLSCQFHSDYYLPFGCMADVINHIYKKGWHTNNDCNYMRTKIAKEMSEKWDDGANAAHQQFNQLNKQENAIRKKSKWKTFIHFTVLLALHAIRKLDMYGFISTLSSWVADTHTHTHAYIQLEYGKLSSMLGAVYVNKKLNFIAK